MQTLHPSALGATLSIDALRQMSAFGALSQPFIEQVLAGGELLQLAEGEVLYHEGERADCFYVMLQGHLAIYRETAAGREIVRTTAVGESVGFPAMLAMRPRLFGGAAASECLVLRVSSQALARLQVLDGEQFAIFFINLSRDMSRLLHHFAQRPFTAGGS